MPRSHKPRKRYAPKRDHLSAFQALERVQLQQHRARLMASDAPLNQAQVRDLAIYCHSALEAIRQGTGNDEHLNHLALATNISLVLCEQGLGEDWIDKVREAQDAVVMLKARQGRIGRYVVTGTELQRLQALLELHDAQLESEDCTEGMLVRAMGEITQRVAAGAVVGVQAA